MVGNMGEIREIFYVRVPLLFVFSNLRCHFSFIMMHRVKICVVSSVFLIPPHSYFFGIFF